MTEASVRHDPADEGVLVLALREAAGHLVRRAQQRHTSLWSQEFGGTLTGPQYAVISAIGSERGLDQRAVGQRASLDKSSAADVIARLEGQGWLQLARDSADRRRKTLRLTTLARTALADITRRVLVVQEQLLAPLPAATREEFVEALRLVAYAGSPPPPGLTGDQVLALDSTPGHLIRRMQQVHTVAWTEEVGRNITAPQYAVLSALWAHPDGIDQGTGADLASLDPSTMADIVARLARRGWVLKAKDPADARRRLLQLSDGVGDELRQLRPAVERVQDRLLRPLADETVRAGFLHHLGRLAYADEIRP
ncbi:MarR family winged helix-turn-helix transcriptional regulator [Nocardia farcinica]|uniref:MarR family winged helix-turn-helix transcriptional regulator n=1 Tax=Nocardia farcinica TaxID=37329 RepID=UPI0018932775|nr:MarR family transcriptional regulator [Nocardia farcinica]MBF6271595.1 MarR family transcriptional regulator [Nocardia farcinica]MCZ9328970.1 MarR family transcriptional regulator [Nocardia farcinica]